MDSQPLTAAPPPAQSFLSAFSLTACSFGQTKSDRLILRQDRAPAGRAGGPSGGRRALMVCRSRSTGRLSRGGNPVLGGAPARVATGEIDDLAKTGLLEQAGRRRRAQP